MELDEEQLLSMCIANTMAIKLILDFLPPQARQKIAEAATCFAETAQATTLSDAAIAAIEGHLLGLAGTGSGTS
jgi:hypothetical protein